MRFLSGFILGILVIIGFAYIHDSAVASAMSGPDPAQVRMVNWDVVSRSVNNAAASVKGEFDRLTGRAPRSDGTRA